MSFETITPVHARMHQTWKEARARLNAPETLLKPKLVVSNPEPPGPTEDEVRCELMDFTIAAVANVASLSPVEVLEGLPTVEICNARNLAMALCAVRHRLSEPHISEYFGVHQRAVINAAKSLSSIMIEKSISSRTPLELILPAIWPRWVAMMRKTSIADIQAAVCEKWGINRNDMISRCRTTQIVIPRQAAMAISKRLTLHSLPEIGRRFGGRDHTTVLHSVRKFESRMSRIELPPLSPILAWVNRLYEILEEDPFPISTGRWNRQKPGA